MNYNNRKTRGSESSFSGRMQSFRFFLNVISMKNFIKLSSKSGGVFYINTSSIIAVKSVSGTSTQILLNGDCEINNTVYKVRTVGDTQYIDSMTNLTNSLLIEKPIEEVVSMIEKAQEE